MRTDDVMRLVEQLPGVTQRPAPEWTTLKVGGRTLGYVWERTDTIGLRQTIDEQIALVTERPQVFEKQFTSAMYGWVVVHYDRIEPDELAELIFEAWRLTAPAELVDERGDHLPA